MVLLQEAFSTGLPPAEGQTKVSRQWISSNNETSNTVGGDSYGWWGVVGPGGPGGGGGAVSRGFKTQ